VVTGVGRGHQLVTAKAIATAVERLLTPDEVADNAVALDLKRLVRVIPPWRGGARAGLAIAGRSGLRAAPLLRRQGARHRIAFQLKQTEERSDGDDDGTQHSL
jgi:hypothetical protein